MEVVQRRESIGSSQEASGDDKSAVQRWSGAMDYEDGLDLEQEGK